MRDIVFPSGNETEFITLAKKLGFSGLVCVYNRKGDFSKDPFVQNALLVDPEGVRAAKAGKIFTVCRASREALERGAGLVFGFESGDGRDKTHYRDSGLNHVLCAIAARENVTLGFSLASVLESAGRERAVLLGRIAQNLRLCRKFNVAVCVGSFATVPWNMRAPLDMVSLFRDLGLPAKAGEFGQGGEGKNI